ncbi:hypothetical protein Tco_0471065 [Tanacetum coccineum]
MMLNPTLVYDQKTETALGAQNPFYLRQAKKAQPTLYDGEELLKTYHVPVNVPYSEEDLDIAETSRNKLHVKMNDTACGEKRVNITPPNYSKENFMATFTPQTQLTPEQIFLNCIDVSYCSVTYGTDLKSENFNLRNKIQNDDHDSMIKHFSKLEVEHFNLLLKYQNLKEHLTAKLNALHDLNERFRAENEKVKQHYKELYDSIKITHAKTTDQNNSLLSKIENLKAQLNDNSKCVTIPDSKPKVLAPDLEVAFRKHTCFVGIRLVVDLIKEEVVARTYAHFWLKYDEGASSICLLSKASKNNPGYGIALESLKLCPLQ